MTLAELRQKIQQISSANPESEVMKVVLNFCEEHRQSFDADARREHDRILDGLIKIGTENAKRALPGMEDGPRKRTAARMVARTEGNHFSTFDAVEVLKGESQQAGAVVKDAAAAFHVAFQGACDLLFDARQIASGEKRAVVLYGLLSGLVDELLAAFHLAQRAFATQAYAHVRSVHEFLEVVELLFINREWLDKWLGATDEAAEKQVFFETRKAVKKSSAAEDERLHGFLSAVGTHAQLRNLQARSAVSGNLATFFFLGSRKHLETANILVVRAAVALLQKTSRVFSTRLDSEDAREKLVEATDALDRLTKGYLPAVAEQTGIPPDELEIVLRVRAEAEKPAGHKT